MQLQSSSLANAHRHVEIRGHYCSAENAVPIERVRADYYTNTMQ